MPMLEVGSIGKAHGLRGEVFVRLITDRTERVDPGSELTTGGGRTLVVVTSRPHQRGHIVAFDDVADRTAAESLRGETLHAEPLDDPDVLWVHELIGSSVVEADGTPRGTVVEVEANPASDLLVTDGGFLVPLTFVTDVADGVIAVDVPAGLFAED